MPVDSIMYRKRVSLYKDFRKKSTEKDTKPFTACKGWHGYVDSGTGIVIRKI